ncbi:MAG TPA: TetR family transcriptional regulator [bacterium]
MPRPSNNTDEKLLKAGRDLLPLTGISGMNIRQVAKKARVNMGMFHYHFKTKDVFARRLLQGYYEEMFANLESQASQTGTPLERLRAVIFTFGCFARDNRHLLLGMFRDMALGEPATADFLRANLHRHVELILRLIAEAQAARQIGPISPVNALAMLMSAANVPSLMAEMAQRYGAPERVAPLTALFDQHMLSDDAIADRVDAILIGLVAQRDDLPPEQENETRRAPAPAPTAAAQPKPATHAD